MAYKSKRSRPSLGELQFKAELYRENLTANAYGYEPNHSLELISTFPAKITTWVGTRFLYGANQTNDTTHRMAMRTNACPRLVDNDIIVWNARKFTFLRYQDVNEKERFAIVELRELTSLDNNSA
jgi:hypothetical protein